MTMTTETVVQNTATESITAKEAPQIKGNFLLGNALEFKAFPPDFFAKMEALNAPIIKFRLAHLSCIYLADKQAVQEMLVKNNKNYLKGGPLFNIARKVFGNGLAFSDKALWKRQRRIMSPVFHKKCIDSFFELMLHLSEQLANQIAQQPQGVDVHKHFNELTMDIATKALFGTEISKEKTDIILAGFKTMLSELVRRSSGVSLPMWVPSPANNQLKKAIQQQTDIVVEIINERIANPGHTMLDLLLQAKDHETGEAMNMQQLVDEVKVFFVAGTETSANTLTWVLYTLSQHPEAAQKLRHEVDQVLQGEAPTLTNLEQLSYLDQVIKESMRLYPPAWVSSRTNENDDVLAGYQVPAGSNVFYSAYMLHRNPCYWEQPLSFIPERFAPENISKEQLQAFVPFGAGPRKCIGDRFALMEIKLVLIKLMQKFNWQLQAGFTPEPMFGGTLQPANGMWMDFATR